MNAVNQVRDIFSKAKLYWNTPPKGRYMNYKEISAYSFGGIGVYAVIVVVQAMILSTGNTLIGNTIGIDPQRLYLLYLIAMIASIPLTALRANIIDNSRSRDGKYRPFILKMGIPAVILSIGFVWMPYAKMTMLWKCITVLLFNIGFQFFFNFYRDSYENLIFVLSSNSQERTDVAAFKSVIYSIAPTIINPLMPLLATVITDGNLNDMKLYKYAYPPIAIIGILLSMIVYAHTREKTIQARTHVAQIKITDALREVARNKYFWIISCAGWLGFLEGAANTILYWLYQYTGACTSNMYAVITFIYGDAALWGMLASPFLIKKFGKKNVLVTVNALNIVLLLALYPVSNNIWLVLLFMYLNAMVSSVWVVLNPSIQADIRDYQHYVSGERIDGMFAAVGLIGSFIGMITSGVLPEIYAAGGIAIDKAQAMLADPSISGRILPSGLSIAETIANRAAAMGVTPVEALNAYDALYNPAIFSKLIKVLILASAGGATLNLIPYMFYDFTEIKQRGVVAVLKIRAFFEDYSNGLIEDKNYVETIDMIDKAREIAGKAPSHSAKDAYKSIKKSKTKDKQAVKDAKKAYKNEIEFNKQIEIAPFILAEVDKFKDGALDYELETARKIVSGGLEALKHYSPEVMESAKAIEDKKRRKEAVRMAKALRLSEKTILKHFHGELKEFDMEKYISLYEQDDELQEKIMDLYSAVTKAKKSKDKDTVKKNKSSIKEIKKQRAVINKQIKKLSDENALYNRAARPYTKSVRLLKQFDDYSNYDEIRKDYDIVKARLEA